MKFERLLIGMMICGAFIAAGCGDDSTTSLQSRVIARMKACDLLDEGEANRFSGVSASPYESCFNNCLLDLDDSDDCAALATAFCMTLDPSPDVDACDEACDDKSKNPYRVFTCDSGQKIDATLECSNPEEPDCLDGSDEHEDCDYFQCDEDLEVSFNDICDQVEDCTDGTDEAAGCAELSCPI